MHYPLDIKSSLSGPYIRSMMRKHRRTIKALAEQMDISQERVRQVRNNGVSGNAYVTDWLEAITG